MSHIYWEYRRSGGTRGGTEPAVEYTFFYGKWNENYELGTGLVIQRIISAFKSGEFVSNTMS
jgi:hypothetical protein